MPTVSGNGIEIAYEDHGSAEDPVLLMVQGLGMPLSAWPPEMIEALIPVACGLDRLVKLVTQHARIVEPVIDGHKVA